MCPVCNEPMVSYELRGVEIDHCVRCEGTWLDAGELELMTELAGVDPGRMSERLAARRDERKTTRRCPRCPRRLRAMEFGEQPSIEIDHCRQGHGLWMDKGELEAVIRSFASGQEGAVASFFSELYGASEAGAQGDI